MLDITILFYQIKWNKNRAVDCGAHFFFLASWQALMQWINEPGQSRIYIRFKHPVCYFYKKLHLRCLKGFQIRLSMNIKFLRKHSPISNCGSEEHVWASQI